MQLIIPAFNEEGRLPATLLALRAYALSTAALPGPPLEVLVVDNASTDRTAAVAQTLDSPAMPVRVLTCDIRGKGAAVRVGMLATTADVVGFMDADGATDLAAFSRAAGLLESGAEVVIGSRAAKGALTQSRHSRLRAAGAAAYRRAAAALVPGVSDTQCGFKLMRGDLAREVFGECRTRGFSFDVEMLARCGARQARIEEFPVIWSDVPGSTFSPVRHGLRSFTELVGIAWRVSLRPARRTVVTPLRPGVPAVANDGVRLDLVGGA